jgi:hypothetical protein
MPETTFYDTLDLSFYVIYSFDCMKTESVKQFQPPFIKRWDCTEGDDQFDYDYLKGDWIGGKHRKYCAQLNKKQFEQFIDHCCLTMEDVNTMGSLTEFGLLPAHSFNLSDSDHSYECAMVNAYVTPLIMNEGIERTDELWESLKQEMLHKFGY